MAINHVWSVKRLVQKNDGSGIVCRVVFEVNSKDDVTNKSHNTRGRVNLSDPAVEDMIPYENLTQEVCLTWVQDNLGDQDPEGRNETVINLLNNPPTPATLTEDLPWM